MNPGYILIVENDELKARTIGRVIRSLRPNLGLVHVRSFHDFNETFAKLLPRFVISDWDFPFGCLCGSPSCADGASDEGTGWLSVGRAVAADVPVIVVSGGEKPKGFDECFRGVVWATDWSRDLRVFLDPEAAGNVAR